MPGVFHRGVYSDYQTSQYHGTDGLMYFIGRTKKGFGAIPIIFFHDTSDLASGSRQANKYIDEFRAMVDVNGYTLASADLAGTATYGNDTSITSVNELLNFLAGSWGCRKDKVLVYGFGMGALLALNWAWRNQTKPLALILSAPIVALENFYNDNAALQASIDAAYTNHTGFLNGLNTHDPMRNISLIKPFGNRIKIFYASDDALVHADDVETYAALTGAEIVPPVTGGHSGVLSIRTDDQAAWFVKKAVDRRVYELDWKYNDSSAVRENAVTTFGAQWSFSNVDAVGGRRERTTAAPPNVGNERRIYLPASGNVKMADSEIYNEIWGGNGNFSGQQGQMHRVTFTGSPVVSGQGFTFWQGIIFLAPWIMNAAVWKWMPGNPNAFNFVTAAQFDSPGLRNYSGGQILGCSRTSGISTYVCKFSKIPRPGDLVIVSDIPDSSFNVGTSVISVDPETNTMRLANVGADTASGGPGKFLNESFIFPFALRTQVYGEAPSKGRLKVWPLATSEPAWGDPNYSLDFTWTSEAALYGEPAYLTAHVGDVGLTPNFVDQGRFRVTEM